MKVAVYTIVKNAEHYIDSWYNSAKDADYLILGDTGSTDNTVAVARKLGITVYRIKPDTPFHFGNARNAVLRKVPSVVDVCVVLDADEVLVEGWREQLEAQWSDELGSLGVRWIWGGTDIFIPRIHKRHGVRWHDRIHEYFSHDGKARRSSITIIHNKDLNRDREFYIDLLRAEYEEEHTQRSRAYLGIELLSRGREEGVQYLKEYLDNEITFFQEGAAVCNALYKATKDSWYLYKSISLQRAQKEAYGQLAIHSVKEKDWIHAYHMIKMEFEYELMSVGVDYAIGEEASTLILGEAAFQTGRIDEAVFYGQYLAAEFGGEGVVENLRRYMGDQYDPEFDKYVYRNWFRSALSSFKRNMDVFKGRRIRGLQIGAYTGLSSIWISNNMNCDLVDVDTWGGSDEPAHENLNWEHIYEVYKNRTANARVEHYRTTSDEFFANNDTVFDFIYIDGDHTQAQVAKDAQNADKVLRVGGVLAFDDYLWGADLDPELRPKEAIDEFIANYRNYTIIYKGGQVWLRKSHE